jgi:hypothetical protein
MTFLKKAMLATTAAATALSMSAPADARTYYRHYRHHSGDTAAIAIGAGILGLAIGAAASSGRNGYYNGGYYNGYYNRPGVSFYYQSYPDYYNYNNGYYYNGYRYYNGWFYDGRGYRMYDRNTWGQRWHHDRYDRYDRYRGYRGY